MGLKYDPNATDEFAPIPNAIYDVKIAKCTEATSKAGNPYYKAQLTITTGPLAKRVLFDNITEGRLASVIKSCRVNVAAGQDIPPSALVGLSGRVRTEIENFNGQDNAKVKAWIAPSSVTPAPASAPAVSRPERKLAPLQPFEQVTEDDNTLDDIPF